MNLAVSVDSLLKLPEGAAYRGSNDRAHVEATHQGGVIYITGTCDSLQRQVEYYESLYHTARDALEQTEQSLLQEQQKKDIDNSVVDGFSPTHVRLCCRCRSNNFRNNR